MADGEPDHDYSFKILLVGDSGVGKSSLLVRFTSGTFSELPPTIGVDFKTKTVSQNGKKCKLSIWDTAGQERFRTLTSSYYRGAHGIVFVYDVTRASTLQSLRDTWVEEAEIYGTVAGTVRLVVGNKTDAPPEAKEVPSSAGAAFARKIGALFVETSAKGGSAVDAAFEELVLKILDTPQLLGPAASRISLADAHASAARGGCC